MQYKVGCGSLQALSHYTIHAALCRGNNVSTTSAPQL